MSRQPSQFRRSLIVTIYVTGIAVFVVLLPARFTTPMRVVFTELAAGVEGLVFQAAGDALSTTGTLRDAIVEQENRRLARGSVQSLRNRNARMREIILSQRRRLRDYENLEARIGTFSSVQARVTSYDSRAMRKSIVISAGSGNGIRKGFAATSMGALVGIVEEVGYWYCRVKLITDPGSQIPCRIQRTRDLCILKGTGESQATVEWLRREVQAKKGDILVTAPFVDSVSERPHVPSGLPVASIQSIDAGRIQPFFLDVTAVPRVDISRLESVEVLVPRHREKTASSEKD